MRGEMDNLQGVEDYPTNKPDEIMIPEKTEPLPSNRTRAAGSCRRRIFLFDAQFTPSDFYQGRLFIPAKIAAGHFPPVPILHQEAYAEKITITDAQDRDWFMTLGYNLDEHTFVLNNEWHSFSELHDLKSMDVVRFYKPFPRLRDQHYLVECLKERRDIADEIINFPEFRRKNFLFQVQVTAAHIKYRRLIIPTKKLRIHFIHAETYTKDRLYFTDLVNKEWCMKLTFYCKTYVVTEGWEEFVKEWHVEDGDVIRFYKPVQRLYSRHFLISKVQGGNGASRIKPNRLGEDDIRSNILDALADVNWDVGNQEDDEDDVGCLGNKFFLWASVLLYAMNKQ